MFIICQTVDPKSLPSELNRSGLTIYYVRGPYIARNANKKRENTHTRYNIILYVLYTHIYTPCADKLYRTPTSFAQVILYSPIFFIFLFLFHPPPHPIRQKKYNIIRWYFCYKVSALHMRPDGILDVIMWNENLHTCCSYRTATHRPEDWTPACTSFYLFIFFYCRVETSLEWLFQNEKLKTSTHTLGVFCSGSVHKICKHIDVELKEAMVSNNEVIFSIIFSLSSWVGFEKKK